MQGLTVEYVADSEGVPERTSGVFSLNTADVTARFALPRSATVATHSAHATRRSELVTLAVVMSMTQLAAVSARALSWLGRAGARARQSGPKGV